MILQDVGFIYLDETVIVSEIKMKRKVEIYLYFLLMNNYHT